MCILFFFFSSRRRHTRFDCDWSSDVCSSDLVVYQPIWSTTWAEAQTPVVTVAGGTIPVGGRTVENGFHFSNALIRIGVSREVTLGPLTRAAALQLGLAVRSVHYNLRSEEHTSELQSQSNLVCR